jgi:transporter family-2 protein
MPQPFLLCAFYLLATAGGVSFVFQQAVNANLRSEIGSPWWAGFISYLGGTLVMLAMVVALREPLLTGAAMSRTSWMSWTGGIFGAIYIAISILLLPRLGAALVVALIVLARCSAPLHSIILPCSACRKIQLACHDSQERRCSWRASC